MSRLKVAVLMGGNSTERDISLWTGKQILGALDPNKYEVFSLDTGSEQTLPSNSKAGSGMKYVCGDKVYEVSHLSELALVGEGSRPDVVVIALHGPGGEDGTIQGMLEILELPYTGSKVLASALAMDKAMTKRVLASGGVRVPRDITLKGPSDPLLKGLAAADLPVIVKPNAQGSTIGMTIVREPSAFDEALKLAFKYDPVVIVEAFIEGIEITVPILGNDELEILPIVEIVPKNGFYDYEAKYTVGATDEICPARLNTATAAEARELARMSHELLGCRGMSRTDLIVDKNGTPWVLEVNTIPGMTPLSLLPLSASVAGYSFSALLDRLITLAFEK